MLLPTTCYYLLVGLVLLVRRLLATYDLLLTTYDLRPTTYLPTTRLRPTSYDLVPTMYYLPTSALALGPTVY